MGKSADLLLRNLEQAFEGPAWHGPSLRAAIRGLKPKAAAWRLAKGRHCIWELILHAAYWKYAVRRRLTGDQRGSFARRGTNFFPLPEPADGSALRDDIALLRDEHARLCETVAKLSDSDLERPARGSKWSNGAMIQGVAYHDIYHAGQIQLLKRAHTAGATGRGRG